MSNWRTRSLLAPLAAVCLLVFLDGCTTQPPVQIEAQPDETVITLLFTNDVESAYDPTPAFWRNDMRRIGGIAEMATLIRQIRAREPNVFLLDAGDIYTGTLAKLTKGEISFELMMTMGYDAISIGNHEFEYGWQELARQKDRVPFPVLAANLFYKGTDFPFAQAYTIIERDGVRIGVIGVLGQDAANALIPSNIAGLEVRDPIPAVRRHVAMLKGDVDLIVVLTHQGKTAPMQTDDEADTSVQRGNEENLALAGAVAGIDVIFGGHTDAGTREPIEHPETGTLIMQTFGQGQHLGQLQVVIDNQTRAIRDASGRLIPIDSDRFTPDATVAGKLRDYRARFPEIYATRGSTKGILTRRYYQESDLGNLFADILRDSTEANIGLMPSGALRKDLPEGDVRLVDLADAFPFEDRVATLKVSGAVLTEILEQGASLERGLLQVSGLTVRYRPDAPIGQRIEGVIINGEPLDRDQQYTVSTLEILAQGGDEYTQFRKATDIDMSNYQYLQVVERYFLKNSPVDVPVRERYQIVDED